MKRDETLKRNHIEMWKFLIKEYELVKQKANPRFKLVKEFYEFHNLRRQTFQKYYQRYVKNNKNESLLPQKRGPRWKTRRPCAFIENKVIELREKGINRYEIHSILKEKLRHFTPSPSGIYNICKKYGLSRLKPKMKENRRRIIKEKAGQLGHIDSYHINKAILMNRDRHYYLVAVIDSCTRIIWAEVVEDLKSLTVMFGILRCLNIIDSRYNIKFEEVMTDNVTEFGSGRYSNNVANNPFKRMLKEMGIKQRFIQPHRPQTNGKIERFWKTLHEDFLEDAVYENLDDLKDELLKYLVYYNEYRPHQGLNGDIPAQFNEKIRQRIT